MGALPRGVVTFLFSDIEGSTALWEAGPDQMRQALAAHDDLVRDLVSSAGGSIFKHTGDGFAAAFDSASAALQAACEVEARLPSVSAGTIRVRMGVHTGEAVPSEGDYFGPEVNRAARVMEAANGGQIVVSGATHGVVGGGAPDGSSFVDSGLHRLKDLRHPVRIYRLVRADGSDHRPLRTLDIFPNNLPVHLTSFVGREAEVDEVIRLVGEGRLVTLTGIGGVGKTRLSLQIGAELLHEYPDGVWFLELANLAEPGLIPQALAEVLQVRVDPLSPAIDEVVDHLSPLTALLILDNCEHLIDDVAGFVDQVLRRAPHVTALCTSREGLAIGGERSWRVPSLHVDGDLSAVILFEERARLVQPDFAITDSNRDAVKQLCGRLDGIPLAIEMATARLRVLDLEQILAHLSDRFRLLTGGARTSVERQRTLGAMMDWSYELLGETEQRTLRRLGVFSGGFSLDAAEAVLDEEGNASYSVIDSLERLVDSSLLVFDRDGGARYRLLETVRQYALAKLLDAGETDRVRRGHAVFYADVAYGLRDSLALADWTSEGSREEAAQDLANIRATLVWAYSAGETILGLRTATGIAYYLNDIGAAEEALRWLISGLENVAVPPLSVEVRGLSTALVTAWTVGDEDRTSALARQARGLVDSVSDLELRANLLNSLGIVGAMVDASDASNSFQAAIRLFREAGSSHWVRPLRNLIMVSVGSGDVEEAESLVELLDSAAAEGLETEYQQAIGTSEILIASDRAQEAVEILAAIETSNLLAEAKVQISFGLAVAHQANGHLDEAARWLERTEMAYGDNVFLDVWLGLLRALIALEQGRLDDVVPGSVALQKTAGGFGYIALRVFVTAIHTLLAEARGDQSRAAELFGHYTAVVESTGWKLRPREASRIRDFATRASASTTADEFQRLAAIGAATAYADLPLYAR